MNPLTNMEAIITINIMVIGLIEFIKIVIGAIFCQVNIINEFIQDRPWITSGSQKWKGAAPIFIKIAEFRIRGLIFSITSDWIIFKFDRVIKIENIKMVDAKACVMKYFRAASDSYAFFCLLISGIIDRRLISRPIHILNQLFEDMVMVVPTIMEVVNKIL